ncbi:hypothetical protein BC830DRAFT_1146819 [Chytriomyces sp. MP71]|nr:hypothetical protein BC830DRAFT_1146819 [Chytriomyces sp. MP71]
MLHHYFEVDAFRTIDNLVAEMESWNVQLTTSTYDVWMTSLLRQDRYGDVVAAFEGMKARGLKANFSIFNVVITALCNNGGSTEQLLDTWSQFKTEGTVGSWRLTLIGNRVLGKLSRELEHLETSFTLFNEIRDVARHVANIRGGNPPPTELFARTYSLAVSMCCRFSMKDRELLDRALILLNDMKQDGLSPSSRIYQGILFALSNACLSYPTSSATKYVKALMLLYHEMLENHPAAFGPLRLQHAVIRAFLKSGEYSEANLAVKKGLEGMNPLAFANELKALATTTLLSSGSSSLSVNRKCMADNVAHLLDKLVNGVKQNTLESNMQSWKLLNLPSHPRFALDDTCVMLFNSKLGLAEDASMRAFNNYALFVQYWEVAKDGGPHYSCHHSRVIDALLCQLPSMSIVPFLLNLESRGWKPSVSGLIELCKQLPSLDERQKLVSAVQGLGWKHKRTYLLLETIINSLYGLNDGYVPALKDAVWQEAGVEEAEVNTLLEFSIENGCSVSFAS